MQWAAGPVKVNLGDTAEINVPDGYQFLDEKGGRFFLEGMRNAAPPNLVGILAPVSTKWFAVIKYSGVGYVKDTDASRLDAAAMLKKVQSLIAGNRVANSKSGTAAAASADWELKPVYDPAQNKLEWAVRALTQPDVGVVNYSVRLLGRQGVLEVVAVQPYQADFDLGPLREIAKAISFKDGERYSDYKAGDKLAKASMAQLAGNDNGAESASASGAAKSSHKLVWLGIGLAVLLLAGAGLVMKKILQGRTSSNAGKQNVAPALQRQPLPVAQAQPAPAPHVMSAIPATTASTLNLAKVKTPVSPRGMSERNGRPSKSDGRKRKKQYNFHLFYSDMIMNLTRWNYVGGFGTYASDYSHGFNGPLSDQIADGSNGMAGNGNGHGNGNSNGNGNGVNGNHTASTAQSALPSDAAKALAIETSKLIENQQKLIEGQRKLIDEQNKLIQEKSKLIDFESAVLEKQSEMIEEQELL
ncbi:MAG TPA: DUF2167 domain-containing protein [Verrucomicrobiae bacterium]|nr:DUF2167 domain-containing protein [Verrucomicrobiae bacterium]